MTEVNHRPAKQRVRVTGIVVSDRMHKSRVVQVARYAKHSHYGKFLNLKKKFMAHDEKNESKTGDRVELASCRPLSRRKHWRITKILRTTQV